MGLDYLMVHVTYNVPLAMLLTTLTWPFLTRLDWSKIWAMMVVSVLATTPWDSYLVRHHIWTYPDESVLGYRLFSIPVEEVFFFIIQTYNTSLVYIILTRRLVMPAYLYKSSRLGFSIGAVLLSFTSLSGAAAVFSGGHFTYLGLILVWACSFLLIQWLLSSGFILSLPWKEVVASIMLPTLFLWTVDTISLGRGTWVISTGTKVNLQVWGSLDLEEAVFFLLTNILVVNGQVAADYLIALTHCKEAQSDGDIIEGSPSCRNIILNFLTGHTKPDRYFVSSLADAVRRLSNASQSMYMGSAMFQGPLRMDLIFLYSFCRVADDLVDEAPDTKTANAMIEQCKKLLEAKFDSPVEFRENVKCMSSDQKGPPELVTTIDNLPTSRLRIEPLKDLLGGFQVDTQFNAELGHFPITSETDLDNYAYHVASTVALCSIDLTSHNFSNSTFASSPATYHNVTIAAENMGKALQYVNIARDIGRDAAISRVYLPTSWLKDIGLSPADVIFCASDPRIEVLRERILARAKDFYDASAGAIGYMPSEVQGPLRATVESYMEIGVALKRGLRPRTPSQKLRLSMGRRLVVAYRAMVKTG